MTTKQITAEELLTIWVDTIKETTGDTYRPTKIDSQVAQNIVDQYSVEQIELGINRYIGETLTLKNGTGAAATKRHGYADLYVSNLRSYLNNVFVKINTERSGPTQLTPRQRSSLQIQAAELQTMDDLLAWGRIQAMLVGYNVSRVKDFGEDAKKILSAPAEGQKQLCQCYQTEDYVDAVKRAILCRLKSGWQYHNYDLQYLNVSPLDIEFALNERHDMKSFKERYSSDIDKYC